MNEKLAREIIDSITEVLCKLNTLAVKISNEITADDMLGESKAEETKVDDNIKPIKGANYSNKGYKDPNKYEHPTSSINDFNKMPRTTFPKKTPEKKCENNRCEEQQEIERIAKSQFSELCERFPLLRFMEKPSTSEIHMLYGFFNHYNVTSEKAPSCGNEEISRKFIFRATTENQSTVCMCIDFAGYRVTNGNDNKKCVNINLTILCPRGINYSASELKQCIDGAYVSSLVNTIGGNTKTACELFPFDCVSINKWPIGEDGIGMSFEGIFVPDTMRIEDVLADMNITVKTFVQFFRQITDLISISDSVTIKTPPKMEEIPKKRTARVYRIK